MITVVVGAPGVGKTHWIRERLSDVSPQSLGCYIALDNPIDSASLAAEFPDISVIQVSVAQGGLASALDQLRETAQSDRLTYLEVSDPADITVLEQQLTGLPCWRVLVRGHRSPEEITAKDWGRIEPGWANAIWDGGRLVPVSASLKRWRSTFTGALFDPASLDTAWQELTAGAYGPVQRAKGLFELADGRLFQIDFVAGWPSSYSELKRSTAAHPSDRFSTIEVVADSLNWEIVTDTLHHCQLSEAAIAYYQDQLKLSLGEAVAP
jgi:Cobalamin synthesis protein cobW C-terminal domain